MRLSLAMILLTGCSSILGLDSPQRIDAGATDDGLLGDGRLADGGNGDAVSSGGCPLSYTIVTAIGTSRYRHVTGQNKDWLTANANCVADQPTASSRHTHLAVVGSDAERSAIHAAASNGEVWVGLSDQLANNTYRWVTDEAILYPGAGSPPWASNAPGGSATENCIRLDNNGLFQDISCTNNRPYMCECDDYANDPTNYQ